MDFKEEYDMGIKPLLRITAVLVILVGSLVLYRTPPLNTGTISEHTGVASEYLKTKGQIISYLSHLSEDTVLVERIADAVLVEASEQGVPPGVTVAIMAHENWSLTPDGVSTAGAVGLMQVMPLHVPIEECGLLTTKDLSNVEINICAGVHIFVEKLERCNDSTKCALLAYNGCIVTNEPFRTCYNYPTKVEENLLDFLSEA